MRISDWSSDVCSSDLPAGGRGGFAEFAGIARPCEPCVDAGLYRGRCRAFARYLPQCASEGMTTALEWGAAITILPTCGAVAARSADGGDRKSTRLNSRH